jgi:hypothetical protein
VDRSGTTTHDRVVYLRFQDLFTFMRFPEIDLSHNVIIPDEWQSCMAPKHNDRLRMKPCVQDDGDAIGARSNAEVEFKGFAVVEP